MHRISLATLIIVVTAVPGTAPAGSIDPGLEAILATTPPDQPVSCLVFLRDQVDLEAITARMDAQRATRQLRHETVVRALLAKAEATQGDLVKVLESLKAEGRVQDFHAFWIANCIRLIATPDFIRQIAARDDVGVVYFDYEIEAIEPVGEPGPEGPGGMRTPEIGVEAVRAPEAWAMGFTGEGILVATLDTGVDGNHPALAARWRGVADPRYVGHPEWAWFDPVTNTTFPQAFGSHGTHTMGTVCGGAPGDEVGVAPGAQWIHAAVIDRVSIPQTVADAILSFQWMLDPNEDPNSVWDVPHVCSNSWGVTTGHGYPPCDETFWVYLDACEAAGTVILFSAGNEGNSGLRRPADRATDDYRTCAVAAIDANNPSWPIAGFSSRGPTYCTPDSSAAIKPDIAAPGVNVRSSVPGGGYSTMSGTSMASPHTNGVVALIRQACPDLTVQDVKQIMYETAYDLGAPGEDNSYGWGNADAYEAVLLALDMCGPSPPRAQDGYYETPVDMPVQVALIATDYDGEPDPPGAITYEITSLPAPGNTVTDIGNGHVISADELPYELVDGGNEVLYTPTGQYYGTDTFQFVADDGGVPPEGGDSDPATISILVQFDPPVIITESLPDGYLDIDYGPVALLAEGGQPELTWELVTGEYFENDLGVSEFDEIGRPQDWHADDNSWSLALPFAFPFYEAQYNSVWVCSNGFIDFTSSDSDWSNSDAELISHVRIAPLWDDLRTDGGAYDIHVAATLSSVAIRWDARTYNGGDQCNFSVELYPDGRIKFHYGSGNSPITPTVGISAGDGTHYILSMYNNAGSLTNANSLEYTIPSSLPEGMTLSPEGVISGIPTESGSFTPTIRVTDSLDRSDQRDIPLVILDEPLLPIDCDGDGVFDLESDLPCFVDALLGIDTEPPGGIDRSDLNDDGETNGLDIAVFVACVVNNECPR